MQQVLVYETLRASSNKTLSLELVHPRVNNFVFKMWVPKISNFRNFLSLIGWRLILL